MNDSIRDSSADGRVAIRNTRKSQQVPSNNFRLAAVFIAGVCAFLDLYAPQPILPLLAHIFRTSAAQVGLTVSASTIGVAISAPLVGALADRIGRRRVILGCCFWLTVPTLLAATAHTLAALIVWRFLQGIFLPGIFAVVVAYIGEEWTTGAASATAVYVTGTVLGGFIGRMLTGIVADYAGWRAAFVVLAALTLICSVIVARWLPPSRRFVKQTDLKAAVNEMVAHLRNPQLVAAYAVGFNVLFSLVATFSYITFHLAAKPFNLSPSGQGAIFCVYLLGLVITPASGLLIDRFGHRIAVISAVTMSAAGVAITLLPSLPAIVIGLALSSSGVFVSQTSASNYVARTARQARSSATGLYVMSYYIGGSIGAILPGVAWSRAGWPGCVAMIMAVQFIAAAIAIGFWRKPTPTIADTPLTADLGG